MPPSGGAVLNENPSLDMPFNVRKKRNMQGKQLIAELVSGLVQEGEHIIVDPSTTALVGMSDHRGIQEHAALGHAGLRPGNCRLHRRHLAA